MKISRRSSLIGLAGLAVGCAPAAQQELAREGRMAVPGGNVVWHRFRGSNELGHNSFDERS